ELGILLVPRPARRQLRPDRLQAVLRDMLVVDDEIVEDRHEGHVGGISCLLMDGGAAGILTVIELQDAAMLGLRRRSGSGDKEHGAEQAANRDAHMKWPTHRRSVLPDCRSGLSPFGVRLPERTAQRHANTVFQRRHSPRPCRLAWPDFPVRASTG